MERLNIGFVGVGDQGAPMAWNVAKAGHNLIVFDIREEAIVRFRDAGVAIAQSLAEVAARSDIVAFCVLNEAQVLKVTLDEGGLLSSMKPGQVLVMHSTISPRLAVRVADAAALRGIDFLDAPVSGDSMRAREEGRLAVFVGGAEAAFRRAEPLFRAIGDEVELLGPVGSGEVGKLCNNLMLFCNSLASLEAAKLAEAYGIPEQKLVKLALHGSAASWSLREWGYLDRMRMQHTLASDEGALLDFLEKDVVLAIKAAEDRSVEVPMGRRAGEIVREALRARWALVQSKN
jgi:3-hydroxyisobutyrate dehydrogenase-like beta-hydroxyacid dehydrogenase